MPGRRGDATQACSNPERVYLVRGREEKGRIEHLGVDLRREAKYNIPGAVGGEKVLAASKEGALRFAACREGFLALKTGRPRWVVI